MKFTPKLNGLPIAAGILTIAMVPAPALSAVEGIAPASQRTMMPENHLYVAHWYNNKGWWKRHAPLAGAAGGGLIGGLAGGGKGAIIGGAAGAGGGYLYKHHKGNHHNHNSAYRH